KLVEAHLEVVQDLLQRRAEVRPRKAAVVLPDEANRILAAEPTAPDMEAGEVRGAPERVLEELEVVMDAGVMVIEVLVVDKRSLDELRVCLESVRLRIERVFVAVPGQVIAQKETGDAAAR